MPVTLGIGPRAPPARRTLSWITRSRDPYGLQRIANFTAAADITDMQHTQVILTIHRWPPGHLLHRAAKAEDGVKPKGVPQPRPPDETFNFATDYKTLSFCGTRAETYTMGPVTDTPPAHQPYVPDDV